MPDCKARNRASVRAALGVILALLAILCACGKPAEPPPLTNSTNSMNSMNQMEPIELTKPTPTRPPALTPTPSPPETRAEFTVGKQVVRIFGEGENAQLYCGFEAVNSGDCPAVLKDVIARFDVRGGKRYETDFEPVAGDYDIVPPGGKTFCALWLPAREALPQAPEIELSLELTAAEASGNALELTVKNARVIQNYPAFATLSGSLWNESGEECPLNVVYAAFYDASGELLGVYHFTKNAAMYPGEFKNFVVHMKPLPIEGLALAASIETRAFGIE